MTPNQSPAGHDTATGTSPDAKYDEPGYEDKSLGQAVNQDMDKVDELVTEANGDLSAAEERFEQESAGAPALSRQAGDTDSQGTAPVEHPTGAAKAEANREDEPPA